MRAVGYREPGPIDRADALEDVEVADPTSDDLDPHDLLVQVAAVSVNPIDTKVRRRAGPFDGDTHRVLGFDASGTVVAVGDAVTRFAVDDDVFHAGTISRPGTNAELHVVDERIVGRRPTTLGHADAAALPLTAITAWELLFEGLGVQEGTGDGEALLVVGGAGGVGSILVQLAKALTGLTVVATASRDETRAWCERMGADHVVDHHGDLGAQLDDLGLAPAYVASLTHSGQHWDAVVDLVAPRGRIALIDDPDGIEVASLKSKALTLHVEMMFARPEHRTVDMAVQHELLCRVADLVDAGELVTTANRHEGTIDAANLRSAHAHQESGRAVGKTVFEGF